MDSSEISTGVPRTYWLQSRAWGIIYCGWAVLMIANDWWPILFGAKKPGLSDFLFPFVYVSLAGGFIVMAFRNFVRLSEDSIEFSTLRRSKVLPFDKIAGRRKYSVGDRYSATVWHLVLEPNDDRFPRLDIKEGREFDQAFYQWFNALPDLDELDKTSPKPENFEVV